MGSILGALVGGGGPEQAIGSLVNGLLGGLGGQQGGASQGGGDSISKGGSTISTIMSVAEIAAMFF